MSVGRSVVGNVMHQEIHLLSIHPSIYFFIAQSNEIRDFVVDNSISTAGVDLEFNRFDNQRAAVVVVAELSI